MFLCMSIFAGRCGKPDLKPVGHNAGWSKPKVGVATTFKQSCHCNGSKVPGFTTLARLRGLGLGGKDEGRESKPSRVKDLRTFTPSSLIDFKTKDTSTKLKND